MLIGREPDARFSVHRGYVDGVWAVGAVPVLVPVGDDAIHDTLLEVTTDADAVLVTGGGDVDPAEYGASVPVELMHVDAARDGCVVGGVRAAPADGRRVLGLGRGAQVLGIAFGGSLHQDLTAAGFPQHHWEEERQYEPVHAIRAEPGSLAEQALGPATKVNSIHHQAVRDPGTLVATAWSDDGVIEAIEGDAVLGVQWHPERLLAYDAGHLAAFEWLVGS
ncbi:MAG: putative glutamine amidotransferase [Actinomycetota bacterium]|nr:putative glutamine amidotransferase [Actinomycetota bacterium]